MKPQLKKGVQPAMSHKYSLSQKDEVRLGIGHGAWGMGHRA